MDIRNIKSYFINPLGKYTERYNYIIDFAKKNNFTNLRHFKSQIIEDYTKELKRSTSEILKQNINNEPIIIYEDDISLFDRDNTNFILDLPKDCDAYYLGYHYFGSGEWEPRERRFINAQIEKVENTDLYRIKSMMGSHAILYNSKKFKQRVIEDFKKETAVPSDYILSNLLKEYNVYGRDKPIFVQDAEINNHYPVAHFVTNISMTDIKNGKLEKYRC